MIEKFIGLVSIIIAFLAGLSCSIIFLPASIVEEHAHDPRLLLAALMVILNGHVLMLITVIFVGCWVGMPIYLFLMYIKRKIY